MKIKAKNKNWLPSEEVERMKKLKGKKISLQDCLK